MIIFINHFEALLESPFAFSCSHVGINMSHINVRNVEYKAHGYQLDFFLLVNSILLEGTKWHNPSTLGVSKDTQLGRRKNTDLEILKN
jgi:hypothetical protein